MNIRTGNDFIYSWAIIRDGQPESFDGVTDLSLELICGKKKVQLIDYTIIGNLISIEISEDKTRTIGNYWIKLSYKLPDITLTDAEREIVIDIDAFRIVKKSSQADDITTQSLIVHG